MNHFVSSQVRKALETFGLTEFGKDNIDLNFAKGQVQLQDISLNGAFFNSLQFPAQVVKLTIGSIDIRFKLLHLTSAPITLEVKGITLFLRTADAEQWNEKSCRAAKAKLTAMLTKAAKPSLNTGGPAKQGKKRALPKRILKLIDNIYVTIEDLKFVIIDRMEARAVFGLSLGKLSIVPDKDHKPRSGIPVRKIVEIEKIEAFVDPNPKDSLLQDPNYIPTVQEIEAFLKGPVCRVNPDNVLLKPLRVSAEVELNPNFEVNSSVPLLKLRMHVSKVELEIDSGQMQALMMLNLHMRALIVLAHERQFRPTVSPIKHGRQWFEYVIATHLSRSGCRIPTQFAERLGIPSFNPRISQLVGTRSLRAQYIALYDEILNQGEPPITCDYDEFMLRALGPVRVDEFRRLERSLSAMQISFFRQLAKRGKGASEEEFWTTLDSQLSRTESSASIPIDDEDLVIDEGQPDAIHLACEIESVLIQLRLKRPNGALEIFGTVQVSNINPWLSVLKDMSIRGQAIVQSVKVMDKRSNIPFFVGGEGVPMAHVTGHLKRTGTSIAEWGVHCKASPMLLQLSEHFISDMLHWSSLFLFKKAKTLAKRMKRREQTPIDFLLPLLAVEHWTVSVDFHGALIKFVHCEHTGQQTNENAVTTWTQLELPAYQLSWREAEGELGFTFARARLPIAQPPRSPEKTETMELESVFDVLKLLSPVNIWERRKHGIHFVMELLQKKRELEAEAEGKHSTPALQDIEVGLPSERTFRRCVAMFSAIQSRTSLKTTISIDELREYLHGAGNSAVDTLFITRVARILCQTHLPTDLAPRSSNPHQHHSREPKEEGSSVPASHPLFGALCGDGTGRLTAEHLQQWLDDQPTATSRLKNVLEAIREDPSKANGISCEEFEALYGGSLTSPRGMAIGPTSPASSPGTDAQNQGQSHGQSHGQSQSQGQIQSHGQSEETSVPRLSRHKKQTRILKSGMALPEHTSPSTPNMFRDRLGHDTIKGVSSPTLESALAGSPPSSGSVNPLRSEPLAAAISLRHCQDIIQSKTEDEIIHSERMSLASFVALSPLMFANRKIAGVSFNRLIHRITAVFRMFDINHTKHINLCGLMWGMKVLGVVQSLKDAALIARCAETVPNPLLTDTQYPQIVAAISGTIVDNPTNAISIAYIDVYSFTTLVLRDLISLASFEDRDVSNVIRGFPNCVFEPSLQALQDVKHETRGQVLAGKIAPKDCLLWLSESEDSLHFVPLDHKGRQEQVINLDDVLFVELGCATGITPRGGSAHLQHMALTLVFRTSRIVSSLKLADGTRLFGDDAHISIAFIITGPTNSDSSFIKFASSLLYLVHHHDHMDASQSLVEVANPSQIIEVGSDVLISVLPRDSIGRPLRGRPTEHMFLEVFLFEDETGRVEMDKTFESHFRWMPNSDRSLGHFQIIVPIETVGQHLLLVRMGLDRHPFGKSILLTAHPAGQQFLVRVDMDSVMSPVAPLSTHVVSMKVLDRWHRPITTDCSRELTVRLSRVALRRERAPEIRQGKSIRVTRGLRDAPTKLAMVHLETPVEIEMGWVVETGHCIARLPLGQRGFYLVNIFIKGSTTSASIPFLLNASADQEEMDLVDEFEDNTFIYVNTASLPHRMKHSSIISGPEHLPDHNMPAWQASTARRRRSSLAFQEKDDPRHSSSSTTDPLADIQNRFSSQALAHTPDKAGMILELQSTLTVLQARLEVLTASQGGSTSASTS